MINNKFSVKMISTPPVCIACNSNMDILWSDTFDDRYGYPGYFDIYRCTSCGQGVTFPLLKDSELSNLYGTYYPRRNIDIKDLVHQAVNPDTKQAKINRWWSGTDNQGQYLAKPGMTVLDYGCGSGASLLEMEKIGIDAYGIEADPNVKQVVDALNLKIYIGSIDDAPFKINQFDMIILNQVIEHIPSPDILLKKLRPLLKPGGKIVLSFPNAGSIYARFFKRRWINWHIPYHLHHFNINSMNLFFIRNGWRVINSRTITPNLWTVLQFKTINENLSMGISSSFWTTGEANIHGTQNQTCDIHPWLKKAWLRNWVIKSQNLPLPNLLSRINRMIDKAGLGDSLLIEIMPESQSE